ncbi:hypothetical protein PLEOSDRAFT_160634 [Pleurotus ostreatus PC15]|uniref:Uncharacterized protein n=1 Tax=Pleurotus ostreatus (strain PC15) TaxID=1137138 RepID=A0A067NDV9_PLEO1|nr:hypothetical protein PLEOSDRAFT_160634 [Pleurotus ostreatus PC15]
MSHNLNRGQRFDTGQYHCAPTPSTPSSTSCHGRSSTIAGVKGLWHRGEEPQEIIGSDFTSSTSSSSAYEDTSNAREFEESKPNSFGIGTYIQEKALAARELYLRQNNLPLEVPKLNPHASTFVPQHVRPLTVPHSNALSMQPPQWSLVFARGARGSPEMQDVVANELINTFPWNLYEVPQLAQHFCWMGALGTLHLAPFASSVNRALSGRAGELAHDFRKHLQLYCHDTFMAFWDMAYPSAITFQTTDASYVMSAIYLTSFMGDLFKCGLLLAGPTMGCLRVLLRNTVSLEHLEAIRTFLIQAGKGLWFTNPLECAGERWSVELGRSAIPAFRNDFWSQTMKMTETSGILRTPKDGEIREINYEIMGILDV